jgi:hypothetical protein
MSRHCCDDMTYHVDRVCPEHPDRRDCPDMIIAQGDDALYRILVPSSGYAGYQINNCPWCGTSLPGDVGGDTFRAAQTFTVPS